MEKILGKWEARRDLAVTSEQGRAGQDGAGCPPPTMCRVQLQQGPVVAEREGAVETHLGVCGTPLTRNNQASKESCPL